MFLSVSHRFEIIGTKPKKYPLISNVNYAAGSQFSISVVRAEPDEHLNAKRPSILKKDRN